MPTMVETLKKLNLKARLSHQYPRLHPRRHPRGGRLSAAHRHQPDRPHHRRVHAGPAERALDAYGEKPVGS